MLSNWIKTAYRNLLKQRTYSLINIIGLSMSLACVMLIIFWINYELSYDKFNQKIDRIYELGLTTKYDNNERQITSCPPLLAPELKENFPEVELISRRIGSYRSVRANNKAFQEFIYCTDKEIFDILSITILSQTKNNFFEDLNSVAISESMAIKYFGENNVLGQKLIINDAAFIITAVYKDIPKNSSIRFNLSIPFENAESDGHKLTHWGYQAYESILLLKEGTNPKIFGEKIKSVLDKHRPDAKIDTWIYPYKKEHLHGVFGNGKIGLIYLFSFIAFFILIIACINYMNLSTARSVNRSKEIGLRKVVGANRKNIIQQFYIETFLTTTLSLIVASIISILLLPYFNSIAKTEITFGANNNLIIYSLLAIWALTIFISGAYPALYLSSFKPAIVIKGGLTKGNSGMLFRKILVIFQFSMSVILIVFTLILLRQINFIKHKDWGFNKEHIICLRINPKTLNKFDVLRNELKQNTNVRAVCQTSHLPSSINSSMDGIEWQEQTGTYKNSMYFAGADADFKDCMELEMVQGRYFDNSYGTDSSALVINETAVNIMGFENPIGKWIRPGGSNVYKIIGVCKDFHFRDFKNEIDPLILFQDWYYRYILIKITGNSVQETINFIESKWATANPGSPFEYTLLADNIEKMHRDEDKLLTILKIFAFIAVIISALGLFGLSSYMAQQKTKEIGIRRVLGSSVSAITLYLNKLFLKWVLTANIIAWPVAFYLGSRFLDDYVYRTRISVWIFLLTGALSIIIALLTISYQSVKAARLRTVDALRHE